jgi:hypothetical protein
MSSRRNFFIRSIATMTGDIAVGYAFGATCVWIIQSAALGLFLGFLLWLLAILMALTVSQYVVHPTVTFALCDRKLDRGIDALSGLVDTARSFGLDLRAPLLLALDPEAAKEPPDVPCEVEQEDDAGAGKEGEQEECILRKLHRF